MTAIDLEKFTESKKITPLWKVTTSSEGTSNDLTSTLPYLLVSSEYFIERDSRGISKGVKGLDDLRIVRLRNEVDSKRYLSLPPEKDEIKEFEDLK
ncbi:hypothetical protein [Bdellovibrio bacteriovorus]|uniref:Uncharacterized protein n=1 Tax=Bdellovibrio bacteriovorus TaxID=959 RepID=A0A1Z3N4K8_BDEBC|nr:hypothetical protein [Bdellovibrio bacteriovorus]ASD62410.1 hypothetical protein B9G79_01940 [Bdellovibrio bacteriovorus]